MCLLQVIEVPGRPGTNPRVFGFTVSPIGQQNEQLECIQQFVHSQLVNLHFCACRLSTSRPLTVELLSCEVI